MKRTVPTAHIKQAIVTPTGMMTFTLAAAAELPDSPIEVDLVNCEPQYHNATTYICCVPWMMHAR